MNRISSLKSNNLNYLNSNIRKNEKNIECDNLTFKAAQYGQRFKKPITTISTMIPASLLLYFGFQPNLKRIEKNYENKELINQFKETLARNGKEQKYGDCYSWFDTRRFIYGNSPTVKGAKFNDSYIYYNGNHYILSSYDNNKRSLKKYDYSGKLVGEFKQLDTYRPDSNLPEILSISYYGYKANPDGTYTRKAHVEGHVELLNDTNKINYIFGDGESTTGYDSKSEYDSVQTLDKDGNLIKEEGLYKELASYHFGGRPSGDSDKKFITIKSPYGYAHAIPTKENKIEMNYNEDNTYYCDKPKMYKYLDGTPVFIENREEKREICEHYYNNVATSAQL